MKLTLTVEMDLPAGTELEAAAEHLGSVIQHIESACNSPAAEDSCAHVSGAKHAVSAMVGDIWRRAHG